MKPSVQYKNLQHEAKIINAYEMEFKNLSRCRDSNKVKFRYNGDIVNSDEYNQNMENLLWVKIKNI